LKHKNINEKERPLGLGLAVTLKFDRADLMGLIAIKKWTIEFE